MLHEGNEVQGIYSKQGWLIVRRCIAVVMGKPDKGKDPVDRFPGERGISQDRLQGRSDVAFRWYACMDASSRVESGKETESTNSRRL